MLQFNLSFCSRCKELLGVEESAEPEDIPMSYKVEYFLIMARKE